MAELVTPKRNQRDVVVMLLVVVPIAVWSVFWAISIASH